MHLVPSFLRLHLPKEKTAAGQEKKSYGSFLKNTPERTRETCVGFGALEQSSPPCSTEGLKDKFQSISLG